MQTNPDDKVSELVTEYALASAKATVAMEHAQELQAKADKLYRRIAYWLARQKEKHSGRKMKIKPARKRKGSKNG